MFREALTIMRIFFLFFVGRRWLQKGERCWGGTSRQTELRLTSVAAFYKTRLLAANDDSNVDFVVH